MIKAKPTTTALPKNAIARNPALGLSRQRSAAAVVANGNTPSTMPPWAAGTVRMAMVMNRGKPSTIPKATTTSRPQCRRGDTGCRVTTKITAATIAATTARPRPTVTASSPPRTAMRVAGKVMEKMATPMTPRIMPLVSSVI